MPFDPTRIETVTVDSYGTLVDPDAAGGALAAYADDPELVAALDGGVDPRDRQRSFRTTIGDPYLDGVGADDGARERDRVTDVLRGGGSDRLFGGILPETGCDAVRAVPDTETEESHEQERPEQPPPSVEGAH